MNESRYWVALDDISGKALTVFSIFSGVLRKKDALDPEIYSSNISQIRRSSKLVIDEYFDIEDLTFPSVLFFQVNDGKVIAARLVPLKKGDVEETYREVSELLKIVAKAVQNSVGKLVRNPEEAYERIDRALTLRSLRASGGKVAKETLAVGPWLGKFFSWMY